MRRGCITSVAFFRNEILSTHANDDIFLYDINETKSWDGNEDIHTQDDDVDNPEMFLSPQVYFYYTSCEKYSRN